MSVEAIKAVDRFSRARGSTRNVLNRLAYYAEPETNLAWPSDKLLARATGLSDRQVRRALSELQEAGEIVRQRTDARRRAFLLTPEQRSQDALFAMRSGHTVPLGGQDVPDMVSGQADTHARAGSNSKKSSTTNQPPGPLPGGSPDLLTGLVTAQPVQGAGGARRRRRRRRPDEQGSVASEPCPLQDELQRELWEEWEQIEQRLRAHVGDVMWGIWGKGAHPHRRDGPVLVVAHDPQMLDWVVKRYGRLIGELAPAVRLVACAELGGRQ